MHLVNLTDCSHSVNALLLYLCSSYTITIKAIDSLPWKPNHVMCICWLHSNGLFVWKTLPNVTIELMMTIEHHFGYSDEHYGLIKEYQRL